MFEDLVAEQFPQREAAMRTAGIDPHEQPELPVVAVGLRWVQARSRFQPYSEGAASMIAQFDRRGRSCLAIFAHGSDPFRGPGVAERVGWALGLPTVLVDPSEVVAFISRRRRRG